MEHFDLEIRPKRHAFDINFKEIWQYRDLLRMFVKRDIITVYKQTVLGPIWFVVQPILTTAIYMVVFGGFAKMSTDGTPQVLFYLAGITIWNYFSESFNTTAKTFTENANIFGKVYFPRLIMPFAKVTSGLIKFGIQFAFFMCVFAYFLITGDLTVKPNFNIALLPVYLILMASYGLGTGLIFTSLTTKYRDLVFLLTFGVQLLMYTSPVIYPLSILEPGSIKYKIMLFNPFTPILEGFKYAFLGAGHFSWINLGYSAVIAVVLLVMGIVVFHKTERNFIDTV